VPWRCPGSATTWDSVGALGGTRTPSLLIRRLRQVVHDRTSPSVRWADIPELSAQDRGCPPAWQQYWQQSRRNGSHPRPSADWRSALPVRVIGSERGWVLLCVPDGDWLAPLLSPFAMAPRSSVPPWGGLGAFAVRKRSSPGSGQAMTCQPTRTPGRRRLRPGRLRSPR
jgi:hypothetical protein